MGNHTNNHGAVLMDHRGGVHVVSYHGGGLPELRRLLNCRTVEAVRLGEPLSGMSIWCDEESKLRYGHDVNLPASLLYRYLCGGDYMSGRCVILGDDPETGSAVALKNWELAAIGLVLKSALTLHHETGERIEATGPCCEFVEI